MNDIVTPDTFPPDTPLVTRIAPSPNFGERRGPAQPNCVILHYTGMPTAEGALAQLRDPAAQVSSHYLIFENGEIAQLVAEDKRAWHAGVATWSGADDINSSSIGIEIANPGHDAGSPPFPARQIEATIALVGDIAARRAIRPERVLAHSDIAPARKRDPGEFFPWDALARAGVGHWVEPAPIAGGTLYRSGQEGPPVRALQAMLALYGYGLGLTGVYDAPTRAVVAAFQRHFRPARVDGEADASTLATLRALIDAVGRG
jgi:N-acetylmuramoyl-L-alanine amidase